MTIVSAHNRYLAAKWLLISGLISLLGTLPLALATWGSSLGVSVVFTSFYGVFAVAPSVALGLVNQSRCA
jgi:F0F1-type ATP synthase membrane subunit c/vacuolar-type H+-ATPase subunit K